MLVLILRSIVPASKGRLRVPLAERFVVVIAETFVSPSAAVVFGARVVCVVARALLLLLL